MTLRRWGNPGKREREARKRRRRAKVTTFGTVAVTLKLGLKHLTRFYRKRNALAVAESEKLRTSTQENG